MSETVPLTDRDFAAIRQLLLERSGIVLEPGKEYLVTTRLMPLVRELHLQSIGDLLGHMRSRPGNGLCQRIVEAMVTTETSFFRDHHPFETLRRLVIPELIQKRSADRRLRIWCAACSTGQEPYSIAIILREYFPELVNWKISLLATDLSRAVLTQARAGKFRQIEVNRGLPASLLLKYFVQHGTDWQLSPAIREMVEFQELNLAQTWPTLPQLDVILIRNVMIYFDVTTKKTILAKLASLLQPDGYLLLGGAESTFNLSNSLRRAEHLKGGFFQLDVEPR